LLHLVPVDLLKTGPHDAAQQMRLLESRLATNGSAEVAGDMGRDGNEAQGATLASTNGSAQGVTPSSKPDGPFGIDGFRWHGNEFNGCQWMPLAMLRALWKAPDRCLDFDSLKEPMLGDPAEDFAENALPGARTKANDFLLKHGIPLRVTISNRLRTVELKEHATN
jgi:hypothetical protein